jgi:hypothetical protein
MGAAPFQAVTPQLDEGDVLANIPFVKWKDGVPEITPKRGIITSHGCACEDYERALAMGRTSAAAKILLRVAPCRTLESNFPEDKLEAIRNGETWQYFYVEGDETFGPQILDLDNEQPVPASILNDLDRVARLAPWQWKRLLMHMAVHRFHRQAEEIFRDELLRGEH